jgi:hypothetical protein
VLKINYCANTTNTAFLSERLGKREERKERERVSVTVSEIRNMK